MRDRSPVQPGLFSDEAAASALVRIDRADPGKPLSKAQKDFNRWTRRIAQQQHELHAWRSFADGLPARIAREFTPLQRQVVDLSIERLRLFDRAHDDHAFGKRERTRLAQVILGEVEEMLIDERGMLEDADRAALVALHDKHGEVSYEESRREEAAALQDMIENTLGTSFGAELDSPDAVMRAAQAWLDQKDDEPDAGDGDANDPFADGPKGGKAGQDGDADWPGHIPGRAKAGTARARAKAERDQALAEVATRSMRDVYRKLASTLHPDREPDPVERKRKTALMQRVNQAYEAADLLQLLNLQIEIEQIDLSGLAEVDDAKLRHYNRVLKEQSERLNEEIGVLVQSFAASIPYSRGRIVSPEAVLNALQRDTAALRGDCQQLAKEVAMFKDVLTVKAWLKTVRLSRAQPVQGGVDPLEIVVALMAEAAEHGSGPSAPRRRRKRG